MKKELEMIFVSILTFFMLWFGIGFYLIGKEIYGSDAALMWVGGMITYMGIQGFASIIMYIVEELK
ncbi:hypothetical protein LCGC14_0538110 [marine sediment metagenome]|uniref:Uncharacterized protein n=1 Tax=marine sediment metagenome TaxID=412755 RepID=A0A0F9V1T7_9ZZZZ|nr:hypothetical protein [bacterium]